ncbi:MAG TPA: hypothetical protein VGB13_00445 [Candidatus Krumholzibacteria bacterium]
MARIRSIKPEYWQDQKLAADLTRDQRLLYIALWNEADDEGRFIAHPRRLLGVTFPYDMDIGEPFIEDSLRALAATKRIVLYEVDGERYGQLTKFGEHQRINRPTPSKLPSPKDVTDSRRAHGGLMDGSPPSRAPKEQGIGSREQGTGSGSAREIVEPDELADWLGPHAGVLDDCPPATEPIARRTLFQHFGPPGMRANAWARPDGSAAPDIDRPRILAVALSGYAAEGKRAIATNEFAGMLRATIAQFYAEPRKPPPGSEASQWDREAEDWRDTRRRMEAHLSGPESMRRISVDLGGAA